MEKTEMQNGIYFSKLEGSGIGRRPPQTYARRQHLMNACKISAELATAGHRKTCLCCSELSKHKGTYLLS